MKCQSCDGEVAETLKASISSNFCPYCGGQILAPQQMAMKEALTRSIQRALENNPNLRDLSTPGGVEALAAILAAEAGGPDLISHSTSSEPVVATESAIEVPEHLKPKSRKPPKPITRGGKPMETKATDNSYESALDQSLPNDWSSLSDDEFLASGSAGAEILDVEGEEIVFGTSSSEMNEKARLLKEKHSDLKNRGLITRSNTGVNRVGE